MCGLPPVDLRAAVWAGPGRTGKVGFLEMRAGFTAVDYTSANPLSAPSSA
jgi:hypothetical protein